MKRLGIALTLVLGALPALAQYKVIGPDGKVTYTDRPPADATAKVSPMRRPSAAAPAPDDGGLPIDLRQVAAKYPVTFYTAPDCPPCDSARQLLQQRGVPFTEKRILAEEDATAYERIVGGRTIPGATIGPQPLRGFSPDDWNSYLDAAGYPRESKLPKSWKLPLPTSVVERPAPAASAPMARAPAAPAAPAAVPAPEPAAPATGIRF